MIVDSNLYNTDSESRAWKVSKINRISPKGICVMTLAQDTYDQHKDYIERDEEGIVIGKWADYFASAVTPDIVLPDEEEDNFSSITAKITCTGKPQFRVGGSAKTFTVTYYDSDVDVMPDYPTGEWSFSIDGNDIDTELLDLTLSDDGDKIKVKFLGDDSYIGKILTVTNTNLGIISSLDMEIIPL